MNLFLFYDHMNLLNMKCEACSSVLLVTIVGRGVCKRCCINSKASFAVSASGFICIGFTVGGRICGHPPAQRTNTSSCRLVVC